MAGGNKQIQVNLISVIGEITWFYVQKAFPGRDPLTQVVASFIQMDYFRPGVSNGIASDADIPILIPTIITGGDGKQTNTYGDDSFPTLPTYQALVTAKTRIVAEASTVKLWMGNIFERATRYVVAI